MQKKYIFILFLVLFTTAINAQDTVYNKGAVFHFSGNAFMSINSNYKTTSFNNQYLHTSQFELNTDSNKIIFYKSFINFYSDSIFSDKATGVIEFKGTANQYFLAGLSTTPYPAITINKPTGNVILKSSFTLTNYLTFTRGNLDLNNHAIYLLENDGKIGQLKLENFNSRILGGPGSIIKSIFQIFSNPSDFLGLGFNFAACNNGFYARLVRYHTLLDSVADGSIKKYFDLTNISTNGMDSSFTTGIKYIDSSDYEGVPGNTTEADFRLWQSKISPYRYLNKFRHSTVYTGSNLVSSENDTLTVNPNQTIRLTVADENCDNFFSRKGATNLKHNN